MGRCATDFFLKVIFSACGQFFHKKVDIFWEKKNHCRYEMLVKSKKIRLDVNI